MIDQVPPPDFRAGDAALLELPVVWAEQRTGQAGSDRAPNWSRYWMEIEPGAKASFGLLR